MLKRLFVGLFLGAVIGAVVAAVLIQGLHMATFGAVMAYLTAVVTGVITGLVAGKPIWSADGKIEAGLKAFFGGLLALGGMFVLRQWVHAEINLNSINAGYAEVGWLPAASLPLAASTTSWPSERGYTWPTLVKTIAKPKNSAMRCSRSVSLAVSPPSRSSMSCAVPIGPLIPRSG